MIYYLLALLSVLLSKVAGEQTNCSSIANEYVVISTISIQKLILNESRHVSYPFNLRLPQVCLSDDRTCKALLVELRDGQKILWTPSTGHVQYHQLSNMPPHQVITSSELPVQDCIDYFPISDQLIGALCIRNTPEELLVVPYTVSLTPGDIRISKLGVQLHIDIDNHLPFAHLIDDNGAIVLYVTYVHHLLTYKLVVIRFGTANKDLLDIPSDCIGPHDLLPVGDRDAILGCTNGNLFYYNGDNLALTKIPYDNIATVTNCGNTTSFVMFQNGYSIIYNRSGEIFVPPIELSPSSIISAACYSHGSDVSFYYSGEDDAVYWIDLEDLVRSQNKHFTVPELLIPASNHNDGPINLYIDGSALWRKNTAQNNVTNVYLFDLITMQHSQVLVSGPTVLVQLYATVEKKCDDEVLINPADNVDNSNRGNKNTIPIAVLSVVGFFVLVAVAVLSAIIIYVVHYQRRLRLHLHERRTASRQSTNSRDNASNAPLMSEASTSFTEIMVENNTTSDLSTNTLEVDHTLGEHTLVDTVHTSEIDHTPAETDHMPEADHVPPETGQAGLTSEADHTSADTIHTSGHTSAAERDMQMGYSPEANNIPEGIRHTFETNCVSVETGYSAVVNHVPVVTSRPAELEPNQFYHSTEYSIPVEPTQPSSGTYSYNVVSGRVPLPPPPHSNNLPDQRPANSAAYNDNTSLSDDETSQ